MPEIFEGGSGVQGYPALVDTGAAVDLRVLPTRAEADAEHRLGVRRLLLLGINPPWQQILARLTNAQKLALGHNPHGSVPALLDDCLAAAVDAISDDVVRAPAARAGSTTGGATHARASPAAYGLVRTSSGPSRPFARTRPPASSRSSASSSRSSLVTSP